MLYDIRLTLAYDYASPAEASRTLLRILPRDLDRQEVLEGVVTADPPASWRQEGTDFFGNHTVEMTHEFSLTQLSFTFTGRVRRDETDAGLDLSTTLAELATEIEAIDSIGADSPHHFLAPSPRVPHEPEIAAFARACLKPDMTTLAAAQAVAAALHERFEFDPTATDATTAPIVAFRNRRGVCQDMSHVMIAALREIGIPAGYVSGFLRTVPPKGQERLEGADAMHAWVRCWCGHEMGWIEIDPTNDMLAGADHVTVAFGRDYSDVAPARGSLRTAGAHVSGHGVDVVPVD
ncbi:transglutaminase family protein [Thetidibacter halocola]|uniref:Transglutaminase family protein n=1 Tax=Thetidibacter halocola TaxID=2827239 RepID=A0A8J7WFJ6_9RHOB|nr:transglutaminase family protein [Thetidibacter halocola]MBS0124451.1 transglutaminase family protein [Thetidibacter halocola]